MLESGPFSLANWSAWFQDWAYFRTGFLRTLEISGLALILTLVIGVVVGVAMCSKVRVLPAICKAYMSIFQNTPLVMQVFIYYNVLPKLGLRLDVVPLGVMGLALYTGAYAADIVASAIRAVPPGQMEAAGSQGFGYIGAMATIILPQAVRVILPPVGNEFITLLKDSSLVSVVAVADMTRRGREFMAANFIPIETWVMIALLYLFMTLLSGRIVNNLEQSTKIER